MELVSKRHLQVLDIIQSPKFLVKFGDAISDFFHLEDGDRCLLLMPLPQCKRESGRKPGSWDAKREGQLTSELEIWGQQRPELWEPPPSGLGIPPLMGTEVQTCFRYGEMTPTFRGLRRALPFLEEEVRSSFR